MVPTALSSTIVFPLVAVFFCIQSDLILSRFTLARYSELGTMGRLVCPTINWHSDRCATIHHCSPLVPVYICIQSDHFILSGFNLAQIWMEPGTTSRLVCPLVVGLILGWILISLCGFLATCFLLDEIWSNSGIIALIEFLNVFGTIKCDHVHHILLIRNPKTYLFISQTCKASYMPVADPSARLLYKWWMSVPVADASANPLCKWWQDFTSPAQPIRSRINLH
jgi:hypothetical protein